MLVWATILFVLGVLAFLDAIFNYGEIFRRGNALMFMLISLGLLIGIRNLQKQMTGQPADTSYEREPSRKVTNKRPEVSREVPATDN
jgi:hypothetical protein